MLKTAAFTVQIGRNFGLATHQEAPEVPVAFQHTKVTLYLNRSIHPQKHSFLGKKVLESGLSVFSRFYTHPDFFAFRFVRGFEALASEFAAGTIFTAVTLKQKTRVVKPFWLNNPGLFAEEKDGTEKNEVPINDDSLGFFPHGRALGCLFCYKSVWNKRAACIGKCRSKGFGISQQAFCNAK